MKAIFSEMRSAVLVTLALAVVCCGIYPLVVFGISQVLFPHQANGSLIVDSSGTVRGSFSLAPSDGERAGVRGSRLLGQPFSADKYFHSRPSAAGNGYDATSSAGSNLGPTSQKLRDSIVQNIADYRTQNGLGTNVPVPADAVTASASGLDPHISIQNAYLQAPRVARVRGLSSEQVRHLIAQHTEGPDLRFLGEPGVNVLTLNLALDHLQSVPLHAAATKGVIP